MNFISEKRAMNFFKEQFIKYWATSSNVFTQDKVERFKKEFAKKDTPVYHRIRGSSVMVVKYFMVTDRIVCFWVMPKRYIWISLDDVKWFSGNTIRCRGVHAWCQKTGQIYSFIRLFDKEIKKRSTYRHSQYKNNELTF